MTWLWILAGLIAVGTILFALALCRISAQADNALEQMIAVDDASAFPPGSLRYYVGDEEVCITKVDDELFRITKDGIERGSSP